MRTNAVRVEAGVIYFKNTRRGDIKEQDRGLKINVPGKNPVP